jgi:hypothetical protein
LPSGHSHRALYDQTFCRVQVPGELAAVYPNLFVILSDAREA